MKNSFFVNLLMLALAGPCFGRVPAKGGTEQTLIKLENDWATYMVKRDVAGFSNLLADDYTEIDYEGAFLTKAQAVANLKSGDFATTSMVSDDIKVRVYGNFAIVTGRNIATARYKGKDVSGTYRWTDTWHNRDGRWVCVASHASKVVQKLRPAGQFSPCHFPRS